MENSIEKGEEGKHGEEKTILDIMLKNHIVKYVLISFFSSSFNYIKSNQKPGFQQNMLFGQLFGRKLGIIGEPQTNLHKMVSWHVTSK